MVISCHHQTAMSSSDKLLEDFEMTPGSLSIKQIYPHLVTKKGYFKDWLSTLTDEDFERTKIAYKNTENLNLEERSSWTCKKTIDVYVSELGSIINFKLLKYEVGDFFKWHKDSQGTHTCLIFCPTEFKGGDLKLKKTDLCEICIRPEVMRQADCDCYTMLIFSTDFLHEVTPITEGVRYVLKATIDDEEEEEEYFNDDWDGGLDAPGDY